MNIYIYIYLLDKTNLFREKKKNYKVLDSKLGKYNS